MDILYSLSAYFPYGTPIASRTLNFCRLLASMGHNVHLFCDYLSKPCTDSCSNGIATYEGIDIHYSFAQRNLRSKVFKSHYTIKNIENYIKNNHVDLIIQTTYANRYLKVKKIATKKKIPLLLEICEKYHYSNWSLGRLSPEYHTFVRCWNKEYVKADAVIAISRFLENHFKEFGLNTVRIPSILDVENIPYRLVKEDDSISFVFSGALGHGKDSLSEFMVALNNVKGRLSRKVVLNIYGPSKDSVRVQLGENAYIIQELGDMVHYHGRIPQNEIPLKLLENDFGIILRPQRESSNAGFPTKLAEYMAAGLPVLANDTGDIGLYLNTTNGILLENKSIENVEKAILAIDSMSNEELSDMRKSARDTAEKNFDYRKYASLVNDLLTAIK